MSSNRALERSTSDCTSRKRLAILRFGTFRDSEKSEIEIEPFYALCGNFNSRL